MIITIIIIVIITAITIIKILYSDASLQRIGASQRNLSHAHLPIHAYKHTHTHSRRHAPIAYVQAYSFLRGFLIPCIHLFEKNAFIDASAPHYESVSSSSPSWSSSLPLSSSSLLPSSSPPLSTSVLSFTSCYFLRFYCTKHKRIATLTNCKCHNYHCNHHYHHHYHHHNHHHDCCHCQFMVVIIHPDASLQCDGKCFEGISGFICQHFQRD